MNKMKVAIFGSILMFLLSFNVIPSIPGEPELGVGRISLIQGQVLIQAKDEGEWTEASVNFPMADGDRIMTERDGRAELQLKNGTYVRVGEISQLDIIALGFDRGKVFTHLNQLEGKIYVNHRPITEEASSLYIDLPYGVVSSNVPSRFKIDLTSSEARISVLEGGVEFKSDGRPIPLTQGKTLVAKDGGYAEITQLNGRNEWDQWNEARDHELFQKRYAQTYLPADLESWGYEMEGNGRWIYTPEYQYVWVPTVVVGWAPFHEGHWAWRRGIYCWIPREPWGWIPFHYGRWVRHHQHGWAWVPPFRHAAIWNPGAVAWHIGPKHVSWVPLGPGEIYYGHRYYGPHSVNINRVNIDIQKNTYINARIKDAVVTVQNDSFNRKNPVRITHVENPFLNPVKASIPPREKPAFSDGKKTPMRPIKESFEKVQPEGRPSLKDGGRDIPSVAKGPKNIDQKPTIESPGKRKVSDPARNRVERIEQPNRQPDSLLGNRSRGDSPPVPAREKVGREAPPPKMTPIVPPVVVKIPNDKEPKNFRESPNRSVSRDVNRDQFERTVPNNSNKGYLERRNPASIPTRERTRVESPNPVRESSQRSGSVDINRNRSEKAGQPDVFQGGVERNQSSFPGRERTRIESSAPVQESLRNRGISTSPPSQVQSFSQPQGGKAFSGRTVLPEVRSAPAPSSKGQVVQPDRGSAGGLLGTSPMRSFR